MLQSSTSSVGGPLRLGPTVPVTGRRPGGGNARTRPPQASHQQHPGCNPGAYPRPGAAPGRCLLPMFTLPQPVSIAQLCAIKPPWRAWCVAQELRPALVSPSTAGAASEAGARTAPAPASAVTSANSGPAPAPSTGTASTPALQGSSSGQRVSGPMLRPACPSSCHAACRTLSLTSGLVASPNLPLGLLVCRLGAQQRHPLCPQPHTPPPGNVPLLSSCPWW